jgi:hypothetical protein
MTSSEPQYGNKADSSGANTGQVRQVSAAVSQAGLAPYNMYTPSASAVDLDALADDFSSTATNGYTGTVNVSVVSPLEGNQESGGGAYSDNTVNTADLTNNLTAVNNTGQSAMSNVNPVTPVGG